MPRKRCSKEQSIYALRSVDVGAKIGNVCRQLGVAEQTYYRWKKQHDGFDVSELRRLMQLKDQNNSLKHLVADFSLDKRMLREVLAKKSVACAQAPDHGLADGDVRRQQSLGVQVDSLGRVELLVSPASKGPAHLAPVAEGPVVHPGAL